MIEDFLTKEEQKKRSNSYAHCIGLGKNFIEHFHKIYTNPDSSDTNHWLSEMEAWFNKASTIILSQSKRFLTDDDFYQWFLVYDSDYKTIVPSATEQEENDYYKFAEYILKHRDNFKESAKNYLCKNLNIKF